MNNTEKLLSYLNEPYGRRAYFDIDDDYLAGFYKNANFDRIEDRISFCESIGNPCIVNLGDMTKYVEVLKPIESIISEDSEGITKELSLKTPEGKKSWILKHKYNTVVERISEAMSAPVTSENDFFLFEWFYNCIKNNDWSACISDFRQKMKQINGRAIAQIFMCPPFELLYWTKRQDMFLLYYDYPELYTKAMNQVIAAYDLILEVAKEAGVQSVFYGAPGGTEFTSPQTWKEAIVPSSRKMEKLIQGYGLYSVFHCCGKISSIVKEGFIDDIGPVIYETASPPPSGDVSDMGDIRRSIDKDIFTHGNMELTFLRDASKEDIKAEAIKIADETTGFNHIIGACDSCIWPGTPPENLKAVCDIFNHA